jgi:fused signal recognition particle receptor
MDKNQPLSFEGFAQAGQDWLEQSLAELNRIVVDDPILVSLGLLFLCIILLLMARRQVKQLPYNQSAKAYRELIKAISELRALIGITTNLDKNSARQLELSLDRVAELSLAVKKPSRRAKLSRDVERNISTQIGKKAPDAKSELASDLTQASSSEIADGFTTCQEAHLAAGLTKARAGLFGRMQDLISGKNRIDAELKAGIEELLITCDFGVALTQQILQELDGYAVNQQIIGESEVIDLVSRMVKQELESERPSNIYPNKVEGEPKVVLVVGVNGVGKTTTIGKLGYKFSQAGAKVMFAACDTFRAAADEQLELWASRAEAEIVRGREGAKPTTVAYEALHLAQDKGVDILLVDTAGRLHNKVNLMNELEAVLRIIQREQPGAPHEVILVIDGSTGQNALNQAREFHGRTNLTGLVLTKLDGTAKGGIVVAIKKEMGVPIRYIGVGEGIEDLREFGASEFCKALFARPEDVKEGFQSTKVNERKARRARRHD